MAGEMRFAARRQNVHANKISILMTTATARWVPRNTAERCTSRRRRARLASAVEFRPRIRNEPAANLFKKEIEMHLAHHLIQLRSVDMLTQFALCVVNERFFFFFSAHELLSACVLAVFFFLNIFCAFV